MRALWISTFFHVLKHVFAVAFQPVDKDIVAEHEGIRTPVEFEIADADIVAAPEHLVGIVDDHVLDFDIVHLAKHFRSVDYGIGHSEIVGIPERRAAAHIEITAVYLETVDVPEG